MCISYLPTCPIKTPCTRNRCSAQGVFHGDYRGARGPGDLGSAPTEAERRPNPDLQIHNLRYSPLYDSHSDPCET